MSFNIILYQNTAEEHRLDKSDYLTKVAELTGNLRETCDIVNPIINLHVLDVPQFNYCYIPKFKRYYYVTRLRSINKDVWEMTLSCDVLMTYRTQIRRCGGVVTRSASLIDSGVIDNEVAFDTETYYKRVDLGRLAYEDFTSGEIIPMFEDELSGSESYFTVQVFGGSYVQ